MQIRGGIFRLYRAATEEQHAAGIQPFVHLHDGDAALRVTGQDGALDRRSAAPARQQRGVDIDTTQAGGLKHRLWQQQAVGRNHHQVGL